MTSPSRWALYVVETARTANSSEIAKKTGINQSSVYRWLNDGSEPKPAHAARFAQAYGENVLRAFIAAGWLTPEQAGAAPTPPAPRAEHLPSDELLRELAWRLSEEYDQGRPTAEDMAAVHAVFDLEDGLDTAEVVFEDGAEGEPVAELWAPYDPEEPGIPSDAVHGDKRADMQQLEDEAARDEKSGR